MAKNKSDSDSIRASDSIVSNNEIQQAVSLFGGEFNILNRQGAVQSFDPLLLYLEGLTDNSTSDVSAEAAQADFNPSNGVWSALFDVENPPYSDNNHNAATTASSNEGVWSQAQKNIRANTNYEDQMLAITTEGLGKLSDIQDLFGNLV